MLSGPNALPTGTYNLSGIVSIVLSNYDPTEPYTTDTSDVKYYSDRLPLYADATLVQPMWPSVSITAVDQMPKPKNAAGHEIVLADKYAYANWWDSWNQIQIPVEDGSDRTKLDLHAAINQLYYNVTDWHAVLPNIPIPGVPQQFRARFLAERDGRDATDAGREREPHRPALLRRRHVRRQQHLGLRRSDLCRRKLDEPDDYLRR